jgi:hypothetical protein
MQSLSVFLPKSCKNRSNWRRHIVMAGKMRSVISADANIVTKNAPTLAFTVFLLITAMPAFAQQCPRGPIDIPALTEQIYHAKEPNVIFRAAAIGGQPLIPALREIAKPHNSPQTVPGAAQVSLARLGDPQAMSELDDELNGRGDPPKYGYFPNIIDKLLLVGNERAVSILMNYLAANRNRPLMVYSIVDLPAYDERYEMIKALGDIVVNAPLKGNGKYKGTMQDWIDWWTRDKATPITLLVSVKFQDPYLQCLSRKVEWGFSMALLDLAATGDQHVAPIVKTIAGMGYPYTGWAGSKAPYIWLRHDYVELALAELGDAKQFEIVAAQASPHAYTPGLVKLQIIGGRKAVQAVIDSTRQVNATNIAYTKPFFSTLAKIVENPPLPPDAAPTLENLQKWTDWWAANKDSARFVKMPPFE